MSNQSDHPIPGAYWVRPGQLLAGPYPGGWGENRARERLRALLAAGVDLFVDLTESSERDSYEPLLNEEAARLNRRVSHIRLSIPDMDVPPAEEMVRILDTIDSALIEGKMVYVHCMGGIGRTGTVVGCFLVRHGMTGDNALREIARLLHDGSPETIEQRAMITNWRES
jgi:protein-tyrosine phosphatase